VIRTRAAAIQGLARAALADGSLLDNSLSLEQAVERLCALPGIGPWTAHYFAMRGLREPDAFPASDLGLLKALGAPGQPMTPKRLEALAAAWRPWRSYATMYLWAML
jgi:AraC family transcriptional regulator of adaptative response / DNA-3-methyladenine glycosylase II